MIYHLYSSDFKLIFFESYRNNQFGFLENYMDVLNELIMLSASQEGFAVGDQKVCIRSKLKIKYIK